MEEPTRSRVVRRTPEIFALSELFAGSTRQFAPKWADMRAGG